MGETVNGIFFFIANSDNSFTAESKANTLIVLVPVSTTEPYVLSRLVYPLQCLL
jgi:hypothetical protein